MSKRPDSFMPFYIGDYLADTMHLSREQHGAYILLICHYWRHGKPLPDEDELLATIVKASPVEWKRLRSTMARFFCVDGGVWKHKRIDDEIIKANDRYEARRKAALESHKSAKRTYKKSAMQKQSTSQADALHMQPKPHLSFPSEKERVVDTTAQKNGAVGPSTANNWNEQYPNWSKFRTAVGDKVWMAWFDHLTPINETTIAVKNPYQSSEISQRYGKFLEACFLGDVTFVISKPEKSVAKAS
jgi:uncharacterized protein YdaU (DUF1376 family)